MKKTSPSESLRRNHDVVLGSVFASAPTGQGLLVNRCFQKVNAALCRITGFTEAELLGQSTRLLYADEHEFQRVGCEFYQEPSSHGARMLEARLKRKDGLLIDALVGLSPFDEMDRCGGVAITILDLSDVKRAERALRESEERLRSVTSAALDAIIMMDEDGAITFWNQAAEAIFGIAREEALGLNLHETLAPKRYWPLFYASLEKFKQTGQSPALGKMLELTVVHRDGHEFPVELSVTPVRFRGRFQAVGIVRDISQRRLAEDRMRQQAALLQATHDAIIVWDVEHGVQFMNPAAETLTGHNLDKVLGRPLTEVLRLRSELSLRAALQELTGQGTWTGPLSLRTAEGKTRELDSRWKMLLDSSGRPKSVLITCNDITEKKQLEAQYLRAQRLESVGTLASGVAHDLNNVLSPILMGVDLLTRAHPDAQTRCVLAMMQESARRGSETVKQLLAFARGADSQPGPVQPRHLLKEVVRLLQQTLPKNIQIYSDFPHNPSTVLADASQLHQVLLNLCVNARDAMPEGGVLIITLENLTLDETAAKVHPKARPIPYVVFKVADSGIGIAPEILDRIFDPFFTTKPQGQGTGLGLATVLGIVESHHGFVLVESQLGVGSTFQVYLPACAGEDDETAQFLPPPAPSGRGELILIVDDEPTVYRLAETVLRQDGYTTITASSATEAQCSYQQQVGRVRLVVTDMMMPFGDGCQLMDWLHQQNAQLPIIAMSGLATEEAQQEILRRGAQSFLRKPFSAVELVSLVGTVLRPAVS